MGVLIIKGDIDQLKIIAKTESGRARKYNLLISLEDKTQGGENSPVIEENEGLKSEILELNSANESLEGENTTLTENNSQLVLELDNSVKRFEESKRVIEALEESKTKQVELGKSEVNKLWTERDSLKSEIEGLKNQMNSVPDLESPKPELTAIKVSELIAKCESLEDLKQYESDARQVVKAAYNKKLKEFE